MASRKTSRQAPAPARRSATAAAKKGEPMVALLRGINVGGNKKVPMAELRALAEGLGWRDVATFINSGNVVFSATGAPAELAKKLEQALEKKFSFDVAVVVRTGADWQRYAAGSAFADAETVRPSHVLLALSTGPLPGSVVKDLLPYCRAGERVAVRGDALWIDFASGVGTSKLTPAVLDRAAGAPVTARNFRTVQQLAAMLQRG